MKLIYACHFGMLTGYGRAAHDYLQALVRYTDAEVFILPLNREAVESDFAQLEPRYRDELLPRVMPGTEVRDIMELAPDAILWHTSPSQLRNLSPLLVGFQEAGISQLAYTTWETRRAPPDLLPSGLRLVMTPSEASRRPLASIHRNVEVIPHCFDPEFWRLPHPVVDKKPRPFTFYSIGAWSARKNFEELIKPFFHAFGADDDVRLTIASSNVDMGAVNSLLARALSRDLAELELMTEPLSEQQLWELHAGAHCYVTASRGEAWHLGMFEALAMGNYIICSDMPDGTEDYLDHACHDQDGDQLHSGQLRFYEGGWTPCFATERSDGVHEVEPGRFAQRSLLEAPEGLSCKELWIAPDLEDLAVTMRTLMLDSASLEPAHLCQTRAKLEGLYSQEVVGPALLTTIKENIS